LFGGLPTAEAIMAPKKLTKKRLAKQRAQQHVQREASTQYQNDDQVLTFKQWCALNSFSVPTGNRVLKRGGPPVVYFSARRRGVRVGDNRKWQESRMRGAVS